jgi:serine/threonine protein kinase
VVVLSFLQEQFEILQEIGSGGMGKVYLARHKKLNRSVALKVLLQSGDATRRSRFLQEAQAASALNHPNIIVIYDILSGEGTDVIAMEYIPGKTLVDLIPRNGLRMPQTIKYGLQIADALAAAHAAGIVHRDLKPANIMVTDRGHVKILDFGLAKLSAVPTMEDAETAALSPLTVQGSIVGTLCYMSPEQAQGKFVDARSDIFSLGSVLYEMATGQRAFIGENSISILSSVLRDQPRSIRELTVETSDELEQIVRRCLRKDPAERWQSMEEVRQALEQLRDPSATSEANRTSAISAVSPEPAQKWPLPRMAAAAVFVAAIAGGWWWFARTTPAPEKTTSVETTVKVPEAPAASNIALTNDRILEMANARVPESLIVSQIRNSPVNFDLSAQEVIRLVRGGVTEKVIEVMRNPKVSEAIPPATPVPPATVSTIKVPDGLPVMVALSADVPIDVEPKTPLAFSVARDVELHGAVVIPKGATARGVVLSRSKRRLLIIGSKVMFQFSDVAAANGARIKIRAAPKPPAANEESSRPLEPSGGGSKPKNLAAAKGTSFTAYVSGEHEISLKK